MPSSSDWLCRNAGSVSGAQQKKLAGCRVLVAGLGGVGGLCAELLARAGIGCLVLLDFDKFEKSNLNRQIHAKTTNLGRYKAVAVAHHLDKIHPGLKVVPLVHKLEPGHILRLDALVEDFGRLDLVLDCLDGVPSRVALARLCRRRGVPYAYAAASGERGMVGVLAGKGPGADLEKLLHLPSKDKPDEKLEALLVDYPQCRTAWGPATNLVGALAANAGLNYLLGKPYPKAPKFWMIDSFHEKIVREEKLA
ncbi:MAG: ThiF family adenylyltransferase [Candidatus Micrarchaeota archaeon]|nr:ThiF family adenylyltransferase [Candidatus Micrarchaeota archaeon]